MTDVEPTHSAQPEPEILFVLHISRQMQSRHIQPVRPGLSSPNRRSDRSASHSQSTIQVDDPGLTLSITICPLSKVKSSRSHGTPITLQTALST